MNNNKENFKLSVLFLLIGCIANFTLVGLSIKTVFATLLVFSLGLMWIYYINSDG